MRIALAGCGSVGIRHARNLRSLGVESLLAHDPSAERVETARALGAEAVPTLESLVAARPDALLVCSPPVFHLEALTAARDAGIDVFVEKPLAVDLSGVDPILADLAQARCVVQVGYNFRFEPALRALRAAYREGRIGRLLSVRAEFGQYLPDWRPGRQYREGYNAQRRLGGGILTDQSHELDYLRWIVGEPVSVSARLGRLSDLEIDVEDIAIATLRFVDGLLGELHLDSFRRDYRRSCTLIGTAGTLEWDLRRGSRMYEASSGRWTELAPAAEVNEMYLAEMRSFLERLRTRGEPEVTAEDGRRAVELTLAVRRSAEEGREVAV